MRLTSFDFEGPFPNSDAVREQAGLYVVLSVRPGQVPVVLDVGESGHNRARGGQGLRTRLRTHDRKRRWEALADGPLTFAVLYDESAERRQEVELALRWHCRPPPGDPAGRRGVADFLHSGPPRRAGPLPGPPRRGILSLQNKT